MDFERLGEILQLVKSLRSESNHKIQEKSLNFWISANTFFLGKGGNPGKYTTKKLLSTNGMWLKYHITSSTCA
jgi:hypothetical protein